MPCKEIVRFALIRFAGDGDPALGIRLPNSTTRLLRRYANAVSR